MAQDGVIQALGRGGPMPAQDLAALIQAAVEQAGELVPEIIALTEKAAGGVYLMPRQRKVLRLGLQALAVAGETRACKPLLRLLCSPARVLEDLFGEESIDRAVSLLLSLYDGDADALFDLAADRDVSGDARWAVFLVLARLAHDGRIARDRLVDFLDRFDRERLAQDGDLAWIGWEDTILSLGLLPFAERVERAWEDGRRPDVNEADKREWRERLARMAADPGDDSFLVENKVVPVTDPLAGLDDLVQQPETAPSSPRPGEQRPDPAEAIRLSDEELDWLAGFLGSAQVPETTMSLEELDGYFAALQVSPAIQVPPDYVDLIWGIEIGARPAYDSVEQEQFVDDLVARHWQTLKKRLFADVPHQPYLFSAPPEMRGLFWAQGFMFGAGLDVDAWRPMLLDEVTGPLVQSIMALAGEEFGDEPLNPEMRKELLQNLPEILQLLYELAPDYDPPFPMPRSPVRSQKIGRNEPCPCGSGKKFKKCCGASGAIGY